MKKQLLTFVAILCTTLTFAQKQHEFTLTPNGFLNSADSTKNFIVVDVPGRTQGDLYKRSLVYLSGLYVSPKDVISSVENESITVNAVTKNAFKMKVLYLHPLWDVNYTISFLFKEGKLRISAPFVNSMIAQTGDITRTASINPGPGAYNKEIFNKKGILKQEDGKEGLENLINRYIANYISSITSAQKDNW